MYLRDDTRLEIQYGSTTTVQENIALAFIWHAAWFKPDKTALR